MMIKGTTKVFAGVPRGGIALPNVNREPFAAIQVGYLGPSGTYSEETALRLCEKTACELKPYTTIDSVIRAVATGEITEGIVPIENSIEGSVNITLDVLAHDVELVIVSEFVLPIRHALLTKGGEKKIDCIISHPQPLAQCRNYIARHYPQARMEAVESTAKAAQLVAEGAPGLAAIGSLRAAEIHSLTMIDNDIQDCNNNCTRFILLRQKKSQISEEPVQYKTSIVCKMNGERPGSLCELLLEFSRRDVNLSKIESRPARTSLGEYIFFFDIEGGLHEAHVRQAIQAVKERSLWLKNLGSYPCYVL